MSEQSFKDMWGRIWKILDEEYNIKEEDVKRWDDLVKTVDPPRLNISYTTFIHPEANNE